MHDREVVIRSLINCISDECDCVNKCQYFKQADCLNSLMRDAAQLLKAQEPRVLTLEEARTYEVVWPEDKGEGELHPLIVQNNMNDSKCYKYGIHWRVWSAKPTDEQRKEVKWND